MANRSNAPRQAKLWTALNSANVAMSADGTFAASTTGFDSPQTILRMIGGYQIRASGNVTALETAKIVTGIGIVSTDAAAAGAASLPDPANEPEFPWLFWESTTVYYGATASPETGTSRSGIVRRSFDIRSMRKVKPRESLVWVHQYVDIVGAPGVTLDQEQVRVLVGLH